MPIPLFLNTRRFHQGKRYIHQIPNQIKDLTHFLNDRGFHEFEGYSQQVSNQVKDLIKLSSGSNIHAMEIGYNAGHSAEIFLKNNPTLTLTSFDLGFHDYIKPSKDCMYVLL